MDYLQLNVPQCLLGENPIWHPCGHTLYWTDIRGQALYRYDPRRDSVETLLTEATIGGFTIQADGALLLFMDRATVKLFRDGEIEQTIVTLDDEIEARFNDVVADPFGRVFCGTMPTEERSGSLYRLDVDGSFSTVLSDVDGPNGMAFSSDFSTLYFTETGTGKIHQFSYNCATGGLTNQKTVVSIPESEGLPDGLATDSEGNLWSALWNGGAVVKYTSSGEELQRISLPPSKITSITFGGGAYDSAFVTTAQNEENDRKFSGGLFKIDPEIRGRPEWYSRIGL